MGKKSLIKSTAKKKSTTKAQEEKKTQKTAAKTSRTPPAKAAKKTAAPKAKPKETSKAAKAVKPASKSEPVSKKRTAKELIFLKFDALQPAIKKISPPKPKSTPPTAPPLIAAKDPKEVARLKALLSKRFSIADIRAAAKAPAAKPVQAEKPEPPAPKAKSEPKTEQVKATPKPAASGPTPTPVEERPYVTVEPTAPPPQADPVARSIKLAAAAAVLVVLLLLAISANNSSKYYIRPSDNAIEIWKGDFSPKDKSFFMVLHGVQVSEPVKDVYSKQEAFPMIFNYYVDKSDALLEVEGLPDFDGIKQYLHQAEAYAVTNEMEKDVKARLNNIERMILLYKADVAFRRNTVDSIESAITLLKSAAKLTPTAMQAEEITQKIDAAREAVAALKTGAPVPEAEK